MAFWNDRGIQESQQGNWRPSLPLFWNVSRVLKGPTQSASPLKFSTFIGLKRSSKKKILFVLSPLNDN